MAGMEGMFAWLPEKKKNAVLCLNLLVNAAKSRYNGIFYFLSSSFM